MKTSRRWVLGTLGGAAGAAAMAAWRPWRRHDARPGACPALSGRTVRWIVPNAAGGGYDAESRLLEPFLEDALGVEIAVENLPGAGGILGARAIGTAEPDGRTLGMVGAPGLLLAALTGRREAPDPATGLSILGRVGRSWHVWAAAPRSGLDSMSAVLAAGRSRRLVFAINEVGSANFASITVTARLLGLDVDLVAGFGGTRAATMAVLRGDVDLVCFDFETIKDLVLAGELRPVLQISAAPVAVHPSLTGVPVLGGPDGEALRVAQASARDASDTTALATALFDLMGSGRLVVAPPRLAPATYDCLSRTVFETLSSAAVRRAAVRPLDVAAGPDARAAVLAAAATAPRLIPFVTDALRRVRQ
jgi:tripartite-type tricarboxylate transporter receptor subunit TctC